MSATASSLRHIIGPMDLLPPQLDVKVNCACASSTKQATRATNNRTFDMFSIYHLYAADMLMNAMRAELILVFPLQDDAFILKKRDDNWKKPFRF